MGMYLNPGSASFMEAVNSEIFIDKTEMILYLNSIINTKRKYISVSRPRRFGKTTATDMMCAYYGRNCGNDIFKEKKISTHDNWEQYKGIFDVIRIVITDFLDNNGDINDVIKKIKSRILLELNEIYPDCIFDKEDFVYSLRRFNNFSNTQFIVIIDEWDAIFREYKEDKDSQKIYLDFLRNWLKDKEYIALAYITGILPIKKYGKHSALNMFDEYSMLSPMQLAKYTGFTEEEVSDLCEIYQMSYADISDWYDGYLLSENVPVSMREKYREGTYNNQISIYSPLSVVKAVSTGIIQNYWNKTETYEALAEYIRMNKAGLKDAVMVMMDGGRVKIDTSGYQNDMTTFENMDDILTLLVHLGYLGYNDETREVFIPNKEILDEFKTSTRSDEWIDSFESFKRSQKLLKATWECDTENVAYYLELAHDRAENKSYNNESALSYAIQLAYYAAQKYYTTIQELDTGKGYADIVYLPSPKYPEKPALLIELKYEKTAKTAIDQIKQKNYPELLEHYKGNILMVGINYDSTLRSDDPEYKHHSCIIEKG